MRQHAPTQDGKSRDGGILYAWAERRVAAYQEAMRLHLPRVGEGGSLASVLDHAMYCGMSLGRVGLDFRPLLAPIFEEAVLAMFSQVGVAWGRGFLCVSLGNGGLHLVHCRVAWIGKGRLTQQYVGAWPCCGSCAAPRRYCSDPLGHTCCCLQSVDTSTESFQVLLDAHKWIAMPASLAARRSSSSVGEGGGASGSGDKLAEAGGGGGEAGGAGGGPPYSLMEHTPLAVYTNGLLAAFNELRHCAPLSLREATAAVLEVRRGVLAEAWKIKAGQSDEQQLHRML